MVGKQKKQFPRLWYSTFMTKYPLILGSASERRRSILAGLGIRFKVVIPEVDEIYDPHNAQRTACDNALRKSRWCRIRHANSAIITADTVIEFEGRCVTKPASFDEAVSFFKMFSGKAHTVLSAVALSEPEAEPEIFVEKSSVRFKKLDPPRIHEYFGKVTPMDKAGAYDIRQWKELIIEDYSGSLTNIMGLPKKIIEKWLIQQDLKK